MLVVTGRRDPIVSPDQTDALVSQLQVAGARVTRLDHDGAHTVPGHLLQQMADFVAALA